MPSPARPPPPCARNTVEKRGYIGSSEAPLCPARRPEASVSALPAQGGGGRARLCGAQLMARMVACQAHRGAAPPRIRSVWGAVCAPCHCPSPSRGCCHAAPPAVVMGTIPQAWG